MTLISAETSMALFVMWPPLHPGCFCLTCHNFFENVISTYVYTYKFYVHIHTVYTYAYIHMDVYKKISNIKY